MASYREQPLPGGIGADLRTRSSRRQRMSGRNSAKTIRHADAGLEWAPLDWQLYFLRAVGKVGTKRPPAKRSMISAARVFSSRTPSKCRIRKDSPG